MTLQELLLGQFKVKTRQIVNRGTTLMTGAVVQVLPNDPNRLAWVIINLGVAAAYLGFERDVSATKGIALTASGGSASLVWNEDFETVGYELFALGTVGDNLYVVEVVTAE